jgi:hypothetical protein
VNVTTNSTGEKAMNVLRDKFHHLIDLTPDVDTKGFTYLATTPVIKQPGTLPYRIVLVCNGDQFIVYNQYFNKYHVDPLSGYLETAKPSFSDGNYFGNQHLHAALKCFGNRVAKDAVHIESIYRKETV